MPENRPAPLEVDLFLSELMRELAELREIGPHVDRAARYLDAALFEPARDILSRNGKGFRARLLTHSWTLAGGRPGEMPDLLPVAIELLHAGSLVIDDIEDDSATRRGEPALHHRYGLPVALNTGNWLYFASMSCLSRLPCDDACRLGLTEDVILGVLRCHEGQALDISASVTSLSRTEVPSVVSAATDLKTGALMGLAAAMGARCAGAAPEAVDRIRAFGSRVGVAFQMLDDWSGIRHDQRRHKGLEDLRLGRATWPWAWFADHVDQVSYADITRRLRAAEVEWELDQVRERIASALGPVAPGRIEAEMDQAMSLLRSEPFESAAVDAVASELAALVRAYG
jgi:geranylgeranyl pyrophosphate synthase